MVEFVSGSGFYPPTFNSFTGNVSFNQNVLEQTDTFSLTITDRVELSSVSLFHSQTSSGSSSGTYTVTLKFGTNLITSYSFPGTSAGNGVYLDTLIQNTSITLEKNEKITFTITGSGLAGGSGVQLGSITVFGKFII